MKPIRKAVINLRGCNASGKTTSVRKFIEHHPPEEVTIFESPISVKKRKGYITKVGNDGVFILGRYDVKNGGCDSYAGKLMIFKTVDWLFKNEKPSVIIFESMLWGKTYKSSFEMSQYVSKRGFEYHSVWVDRKFDSVIRLLEARNGGSDYDVASVLRTYEGILRVSRKMAAQTDFKFVRVDVNNTPLEKMGEVLTEIVYGKPFE